MARKSHAAAAHHTGTRRSGSSQGQMQTPAHICAEPHPAIRATLGVCLTRGDGEDGDDYILSHNQVNNLSPHRNVKSLLYRKLVQNAMKTINVCKQLYTKEKSKKYCFASLPIDKSLQTH